MVKITISKHKEAARVLRRLYAIMTRQLDMIEARHKQSAVKGQELMTFADSEKEARTLGNLTKQLEQMMALEQSLKSKNGQEGEHDRCDTQQLRESLTQRLAKFGDLSPRGRKKAD